MSKRIFAETLLELRKSMGLSQKEFSEFLAMPPASISAYEKGRNSPTLEVLVTIAEKCNVSLDWLCGLSGTRKSIATLGDVAQFLYLLQEINEVGLEIEVHDRLSNDVETDTEQWYTRITVFGNDRRYKYNSDLCNIIREIRDNYADLEDFSLTKEMYELAVEQTVEHYNLPLTKKVFPELSRDERLQKRIEYLKSLETK